MPVRDSQATSAWGGGGQVAIVLSEPDAPPRIDTRALCESFGLGRREASAVALLASGRNPHQIANDLGLSLGTVRNYIKRAFHKTDTHSQAGLTALARGFVGGSDDPPT